MEPGDLVEVYMPFMYNIEVFGPEWHWFNGYEFVSSDGKTAQVKHTDGIFDGVIINVSLSHVRKQTELL